MVRRWRNRVALGSELGPARRHEDFLAGESRQVRRTGLWSVFSGMRRGDFVAGEGWVQPALSQLRRKGGSPQVRRTGIESVFSGMRRGDFVAGEAWVQPALSQPRRKGGSPQVRRTGIESVFSGMRRGDFVAGEGSGSPNWALVGVFGNAGWRFRGWRTSPGSPNWD